jgi:hypothetical protein
VNSYYYQQRIGSQKQPTKKKGLTPAAVISARSGGSRMQGLTEQE